MADQPALGRAEEKGRARAIADRECDSSYAEQPIEDEIDDWANASPLLQNSESRHREERSAARTAAMEPPLALRMAKEAEAPVLTPPSGAVAAVATGKRSKRGAAAAVVGN